MIDRFAAPDPIKDEGFFLYAIRWKDDGYRLPDDFRRRVTEEPLCGFVPRQYDTIQILGDDRIVRQLKDGGQPGIVNVIFYC
jgi:hypothetical protein